MILTDRLELLLDSTFIHYAADCYQWALDSEIELNSLDEDHRKEVLTYHRGEDYKTKALLLVNQEYQDTLKDKHLSDITLPDLERCWYIHNRTIPRDPLGIIYSWFTAHAALYIPDRFGQVLKPITTETKDEALNWLFKEFMDWAERNDHLRILSFRSADAAYIDELEGLFKMTIKLLTTKNSYLRQIFDRMGSERPLIKGREETSSNPTDIGKNAQSM